MSSNTYTLKIDIDDSKIRELEKRLMAVMGGKTSGLSGLAGAATGKNDKSALMQNIGKLGVIAIGVGSLVALVSKLTGMIVDSSPMLKQMLKLFNYSVMLILRPIGDFFGFFLRPLVIYFLRSVALPFYKQMRPIMQAVGTFVGMDFLRRQQEIDSIESLNATDAGFGMTDGMKNIEKSLLSYASFLDLFGKGDFHFESTKEAIASLKGVFTAMSGIKLPDLDWSVLLKSVTGIVIPTLEWSGIQDKINTAIAGIIDFDFDSIMITVGNKIKAIWDGILEKIYEILPFLRPEESTPTTTPLPPYAGSLDHVFSNENPIKAEEDPITAGWNWFSGGINETIKAWGLS